MSQHYRMSQHFFHHNNEEFLRLGIWYLPQCWTGKITLAIMGVILTRTTYSTRYVNCQRRCRWQMFTTIQMSLLVSNLRIFLDTITVSDLRLPRAELSVSASAISGRTTCTIWRSSIRNLHTTSPSSPEHYHTTTSNGIGEGEPLSLSSMCAPVSMRICCRTEIYSHNQKQEPLQLGEHNFLL